MEENLALKKTKELKKALLLANPNARKVKKELSKAVVYLQELGLEILYKETESPLDFRRFISQNRETIDFVIIAGGDGTLNLAVESLVETGLPLAILPLGTANDLAKTLGIPFDLEAACRAIATGKKHYIDLGCVNGKYFFNVASIGLSVEIARRLTKEVKHRWGIFAYAITAIRTILKSKAFSAEIRFGELSSTVKTLQIAVGNGRHYGGGMTIAYDATIDDQRLDFYSLEIKHCWQLIGVLPALLLGRYQKTFGVRTFSGSEMEVFTSQAYPINTDGEVTTYTPAYFQVIPEVLPVIIPTEKKAEILKLNSAKPTAYFE